MAREESPARQPPPPKGRPFVASVRRRGIRAVLPPTDHVDQNWGANPGAAAAYDPNTDVGVKGLLRPSELPTSGGGDLNRPPPQEGEPPAAPPPPAASPPARRPATCGP